MMMNIFRITYVSHKKYEQIENLITWETEVRWIDFAAGKNKVLAQSDCHLYPVGQNGIFDLE